MKVRLLSLGLALSVSAMVCRADALVPCPDCGREVSPRALMCPGCRGEMLPEEAFAKSQELAIRSDVFLVLGTSLTVYPAAGLPRLTLQAGGKVFVVNGSPTSIDDQAAGRYTDLAAFAEAVLFWEMD